MIVKAQSATSPKSVHFSTENKALNKKYESLFIEYQALWNLGIHVLLNGKEPPDKC